MITIDFSKRGKMGLCEYLISFLKNQILDGSLKANTKLPSKRNLSEHLGISVITVQNAYAQLISEGYIYSIEKKGFFVTELPQKMKIQSVVQNQTDEGKIESEKKYFADFTNNSTCAKKFPFAKWSYETRQILNTCDQRLLQKTALKGSQTLRNAISKFLYDFRGLQTNPEQIVIAAGTESLYSMIVQFFGREKKYAIENPGYKKAKNIFELNGAKCIPISIDNEGINPVELEKAKAEIVHFSPNHHFPTGIVMPIKRRMQLLSWANENKNRYLIEDDYDSEFRFNGKALPNLQSIATKNNVIYMNSFTKTLSPSFRISYMVLPESLLQPFEKKMSSYSCQVGTLEQLTLAKFIQDGFYEKHINRMKNYYRTLRNEIILELEKSKLFPISKITEEDAGLHFLLTIQTDKSATELQNSLKKNGIKVSLLQDYFYDDDNIEQTDFSKTDKTQCTKQFTHSLVINYSALEKESIKEIVQRLEKAYL